MEFDQKKMSKNCQLGCLLLGGLIYAGFLWEDLTLGNLSLMC